jgi:hypothetical protein
MHAFIAFTRAHAPETDQPLGAREDISFIGIHMGYILIGLGLIYWVGPKRIRIRRAVLSAAQANNGMHPTPLHAASHVH